MTLYEQLGGKCAVAALVDKLYSRVLNDPLIGPFFHQADFARLKMHQLALFSQVLDGPFQYTNGMLTEAHSRFAIERRHFDAFVANLESALREMGTPPPMVTQVISRVTDLASRIVNTQTSAAAVL